jgi:hypothetical protein
LFALAAGTSLFAQTQPEAKPIVWPAIAQPSLTYSTYEEPPTDGIRSIVGVISGEGIAWDNDIFHSWRIAKDSSGYAIAFIPKNGQDLKLGIAVFKPSEFLPEISDAIWEGYLVGLQRIHDSKCDVLDQLSATVAGCPWVPVLGVQTRSITFRYPIGGNKYKAETQLFAFCKDRLVVFVLSGPEKEVQAATPAFYSTVHSVRAHPPQYK